ncbi:repressor ROX1 [Favolaschia claudopus]|uniref:Repressor ROX1 n=1 Tax=Favolaschia claudopus TaxID=2862362 RepID=A0AAW0DYB3_9AGAR
MPALRTRDTHPAARSLEVNTSAPPPSLTIISPTPRAFNFPISHNLSDSPYSSPSHSPFEPDDLHALSASSSTPSSSSSQTDECRTPPPLPLSAFTRTLTPAPAPSSPSPPPVLVRRKSTSAAGAPEERRPKKGDDDYIKRPENAFILFRRKCCEDRALSLSAPSSASSSVVSGPSSADSPSLAVNSSSNKKQRQADLSKTISQQWKALPSEERAKWESLAKEKKKEHETLYPNYVYRPQRTSNKNRVHGSSGPFLSSSPSSQKRKHSAPPSKDIEFVVPAPRSARSSSVPTPPPHQAIQIPNVYMPVSSVGSFSLDSPESPTSLMPMIARRGVGNGHGGFDYLPSFAAFDFEASLQSSDFLRAMFPQPTAPPPTASGSGTILSPASSTSGSGPSSPYTPASATFHPSAFTYTPPHVPVDPASFSSTEMSLGIDTTGATAAGYASAWAASSPWTANGGTPGLAEGDFDIASIPEIGWELGCAAFPAAQPVFPAVPQFLTPDGTYTEAVGPSGEFVEHGGDAPMTELDLNFGDLGMDEMGFDEMMAGQGF